jgi:hypothetical protein
MAMAADSAQAESQPGVLDEIDRGRRSSAPQVVCLGERPSRDENTLSNDLASEPRQVKTTETNFSASAANSSRAGLAARSAAP